MQEPDNSKEELAQKLSNTNNDNCSINLYKKIFLTTNDHYSIISSNYEYIEVNNSYLKAHGIRQFDIIGYKVSDIFGLDIFEKHIKANIDRCLAGEEIHYNKWFEFPIGNKRYMQVSYFPCLDNSQIKAVIINSHDVTQLKENQIKISQDEKKMRDLVENVQEGIASADENENFVFANKVACKIFGYSNDELIGMNLKELTSEESFLLIQNETKKRKNGAISKYTLNIFRKDGEKRTIELTSTPQFDNDNNYTGSLGIFHDITENIFQEKQIRQQNKKLKKINSEKDKLFSIIAHDLRSPFSGILGFSDLLTKNYDTYSDSKKYEMIKYINTISQETLNLLENLLEWANFQKNKTTFSLTEIDLKSLVKNELISIKKTALLKNIIVKNLIEKEINFLADKNMLLIILRNLLTNAVKFTEPNGEVIIESFKTENSKTIIKITDSGIGIEKERIPNLFSIDQNTSTIGTNSEKGSGLGLVLCKEFVEKHGGTIWLESEIGVGTSFFISFPSYPDSI